MISGIAQKKKFRCLMKILGVGIYDIAYDPYTTCQISASCAKICQSVPTLPGAPASDTTFVIVQNSIMHLMNVW